VRRRFFVEKFEGDRAFLRDDAAHHLGRVLRAEAGQIYELSDGAVVRLGRVEKATRDAIEFSLGESVTASAPRIETTLLLSVVKFERFEWAIEKATELGVSEIIPVDATRSEKGLVVASVKRAERWGKILIGSAQQARRLRPPVLHPLQTAAAAFRSQMERGVRIMLSEQPGAKPLAEIRGVISRAKMAGAALAVGPEGGWTDDEFKAARDADFMEASLGTYILRTETAVTAGLACLNFALE
jgi:16S rRNA (uracil1498-N3)-methyltransferase